MSSSSQTAANTAAQNGFGIGTYWNKPAQGRKSQRKLSSKYSSLKPKNQKVKAQTRSPSPTSSYSSTHTVISPSRPVQQTQKSKEEENDDKDEKSIIKIMKSTMPKFSNEADWEMAAQG